MLLLHGVFQTPDYQTVGLQERLQQIGHVLLHLQRGRYSVFLVFWLLAETIVFTYIDTNEFIVGN